jgi:hypothetical protein
MTVIERMARMTWITNVHRIGLASMILILIKRHPNSILTDGAPRATPNYTSAELSEMGIVGIYSKEDKQ